MKPLRRVALHNQLTPAQKTEKDRANLEKQAVLEFLRGLDFATMCDAIEVVMTTREDIGPKRLMEVSNCLAQRSDEVVRELEARR